MSALSPLVLSLAEAALSDGGYEPFRPGIEIRPLYRTENGPAAALLRYRPGVTLPRHSHDGYEHIYVIQGEQSDERGTYGPGTLIVNPPGTGHTVISRPGCVVLVIWEKQPRFADTARET
jgi:anti-sigma factor ChrR (cupin superfamily)